MITVYSVQEMQNIGIELFKSDYRVGLVPTMGALHEGHLSLVRQSLEENDLTIVSIFINPTQFAPNEDLSKYPTNFKADEEELATLNVDYLFVPSKQEMYPKGFLSIVKVKSITDKLCGAFRPSHFQGVTIICAKLFNIIMPQIVYLGQKDYQQCLVLRQMVKDFNYPLEIKIMPIVRNKDGLALSSRNTYLSYYERQEATKLYKSIKLGEGLIKKGERNVKTIKRAMEDFIRQSHIIKVQYIAISCASDLIEYNSTITNSPIIIALAAYIKDTRLIDNSIIEY